MLGFGVILPVRAFCTGSSLDPTETRFRLRAEPGSVRNLAMSATFVPSNSTLVATDGSCTPGVADVSTGSACGWETSACVKEIDTGGSGVSEGGMEGRDASSQASWSDRLLRVIGGQHTAVHCYG